MIGNRLSRYFFFILLSIFLWVLGYKWIELGGIIPWRDMLLYYGVPLLLSCMALACAFLPALTRAILSLCLLSLSAGTGAAEIFLGLNSLSDREVMHRAFIFKWAEQDTAHDSRRLLVYLFAQP